MGFNLALYIYIIFSLLIVGYTFMVDSGAKNKLKLLDIPLQDFQNIKKYSVFLIFPFASRILSAVLNSIRWTGIIMIIVIFMSDGIVPYFAIIPGFIFFFCGNISVSLDPIFFLTNAIDNGKTEFYGELQIIKEYLAKINGI